MMPKSFLVNDLLLQFAELDARVRALRMRTEVTRDQVKRQGQRISALARRVTDQGKRISAVRALARAMP